MQATRTKREHDYEIHGLRACVWRGLYALCDDTGNVPVYDGYDRKAAQPIIGDLTAFYETLDRRLREHAYFLDDLGCFATLPNRMQTLNGIFVGMRAEGASDAGAYKGAPFVMQLWMAVDAFLQCMRGQQVLLLETHPDRAYALDSGSSDGESDADSHTSAKSGQSAASGKAPASPRFVPSSLPPVLEATSSVLVRNDLFDRDVQCVVTVRRHRAVHGLACAALATVNCLTYILTKCLLCTILTKYRQIIFFRTTALRLRILFGIRCCI
jgi:hypothetical protein